MAHNSCWNSSHRSKVPGQQKRKAEELIPTELSQHLLHSYSLCPLKYHWSDLSQENLEDVALYSEGVYLKSEIMLLMKERQ